MEEAIKELLGVMKKIHKQIEWRNKFDLAMEMDRSTAESILDTEGRIGRNYHNQEKIHQSNLRKLQIDLYDIIDNRTKDD